jgi:hypothetical protein
MKYVYVLTSSPSDLYYEQFFLSITSLRLFNPAADIVVLCDRLTKNSLTGLRSGYEKSAPAMITIDTPAELSQKESSRWIKTSISDYVSGDFLFIDCDTLITGRLDPVFPPEITIGAVLDTHVGLPDHYLKNTFRHDNKKLGFAAPFKNNLYFNGGLLFCREDPLTKDFFKKWHSLWKESRRMGNSQDMPSLNEANYQLGNIIKELDGAWNCQISNNGLKYLYDSKIIHYYATSIIAFTSPYLFASNDILLFIKKNGDIDEITKALLRKPKTAFKTNSRIISDQVVFDILDSAFFSKLLWLRRRHEKSFWKLNTLINRIKKPLFVK